MGARLGIDLSAVRPIIDGQWHITRISRPFAPSDELTTLCGRTEPIIALGIPRDEPVTQCEECVDRQLRAENGACRARAGG